MNFMKKIINGDEFEIYELDGEKRIRKDGFNISLEEFEKFSKLNPEFYKLSSEKMLDLFHKLNSSGVTSR